MFRRDVDYCSGAFLLTPTALFRRLGGFDERYAPAYYEETDYCVRLWKAGPARGVRAGSGYPASRVRQRYRRAQTKPWSCSGGIGGASPRSTPTGCAANSRRRSSTSCPLGRRARRGMASAC